MIRFQGTDGVRRPVRLSNDPAVAGLPPQEAFLKHGYLTERFMELYLYCRIRQLKESGAVREGETSVIGWDPRDPEGAFTGAAVRGLLKGGVNVVNLAVAPTPLIVLYAQHIGAAGSVAVTASHNPPAYNGIKLFTRRGLKLLPPDDMKLSERVMNTSYDEASRAAPRGYVEDRHEEAVKVFEDYSLDPVNSWIDDRSTLNDVTLVVDASNGAMAEAASVILPKAGFAKVIMTGVRQDGRVNENCGAAELEGVDVITRNMAEGSGEFSLNEAVSALFAEGREYIGMKRRAMAHHGDHGFAFGTGLKINLVSHSNPLLIKCDDEDRYGDNTVEKF